MKDKLKKPLKSEGVSGIKKILENKKLLYIIGGVLLALVVAVLLFIFLKKDKTYTVTFDTDGGSVIEQVVVKEGKSVVLPEEPTKEGFKFNGWLLDEKPFLPSTKITKDIKLVAKWLDENAVTFNVVFDMDNGEPVMEQEVEEGSVVLRPTDPSKANSIFGGWFLDGVEYDFAQPVVADITLVAQWSEDSKVEEKKEEEGKKEEGSTVKKVEVSSIALNKTSLSLRKGKGETLVATVSPANATDKSVTWSSSNEGVVRWIMVL